MTITAYLDTCIISGLARQDLSPEDQAALAQILERYKRRELNLVTSEVAKQELARIPGELRKPHETIYNLLTNIPTAVEARTDSGLTLMGAGGGRKKDPVYADLRRILPDPIDALHVFQAVKSGVLYFVTTDQRTILPFAEQIETKYGIRIVNPSLLASLLV